jgi:hypothetical protein
MTNLTFFEWVKQEQAALFTKRVACGVTVHLLITRADRSPNTEPGRHKVISQAMRLSQRS